MLALATTIGDRIHRELAVYGANIIVTPKADTLDVKIGGQNLKPATGNAYLHESDLPKLQTIFWHNNITAISPELDIHLYADKQISETEALDAPAKGLWFNETGFLASNSATGSTQLHPSWKITGTWPQQTSVTGQSSEIVVGFALARRGNIKVGDDIGTSLPFSGRGVEPMVPFGYRLHVTGIVDAQGENESFLLPLKAAQLLAKQPDAISSIEIAARTRPEDAFARQNPDSLSPKQRDLWYCRPYANSIAYQIQEAIPNSTAQQVRKVEQSEGTVLSRISGLMWLISAAALLAAGFAVSAAMATAVLERRTEIGLMRSLGSSRATVAALFYSESAILATAAGTLGFLTGSGLAWALGRSIFPGQPTPLFNPVLLPAILALAIVVAIAGSTPAIRSALNANPSQTLRTND